jgi:hypothetical protein
MLGRVLSFSAAKIAAASASPAAAETSSWCHGLAQRGAAGARNFSINLTGRLGSRIVTPQSAVATPLERSRI